MKVYNPKTKKFEDDETKQNNTSINVYDPSTQTFGNKVKEPEQNTWLRAGALQDGYQFGDIGKTILGTGADILHRGVKGIVKTGEGIGDFGAYLAAQGIETLGNKEYANQVRKAANESLTDKVFAPIDKTLDKNSLLGKKSQGVAESIGQIGAYAATGGLGKGAGAATMFTSAAGSAGNEAYSKENVKNEQAWTKILGGGAISVATENLFGLFGKSGLDTAVANKISGKLTKGISKVLARQGIQATGEAVEEFLEYAGNQLLDMGIDAASQGKGAKFHEDWNWEEVGQQMAMAAIASGIVGAGTTALGVKGTPGSNLNEKINNYAELIDIQEGVKPKEQVKLPGIRTEQSLTNDIEQLKEQQKATTDNKLKQELATKISGLEQELNQFKLPMASTEGMNLMESASKYNIKPETQSAVQNLMENRGIESRWDATKFSDNSVNALWTKDANGNRSVIFNPNASLDTIVEEVALHELTHDILSSENTTLNTQEILDYVSQLDGYNEARRSLENTYSTMYDPNSADFKSLIDEEVVADVLGRKLGNQEFINQLVNSKPSIAKSIYNWVISKLNSIVNKGKVRSEKLYWQNIKNNFENAYKQEYKNKGTASTKYSLSKSQQKYLEKTNNGEKLKEREFYSLYSAHKILNTENAMNIINSIKENGFKGDGGFGVNLMPSNIIYNQDGTPMFAPDRQYAPKKGEYVLFVPENEVDTSGGRYRVKQGYKPRDFEIVQVERDYQPYYELYEKAYNEANQNRNKASKTTDNQGRTLSKQQQEYFKDSKARDNNGNLLEVYHGTSNDFNIYDTKFIGKNGLNYGIGFYLTNDIEEANKFAKNGILKKQYVNIEKPLNLNKKTISKNEIENIVKELNNKYNYYKTNEELITAINQINNLEKNDYILSTIKDRFTYPSWELDDINTRYADIMNSINNNTKYDGIIVKSPYEKGKNIYIPFQSNQIKNIDNTNPTTNEDIRYSKENAEWNEFLDKNLKDAGTSGTLMALHSLSEDKLLSLLDLDGIPVPSLGITDANSSDVLDEFGGKNGVFLIFSKDTINPKNKLNEVYSRDIYSKIVPEIYQKVDKKTYNKVMSEFRPYESKYGTFNRDYSYNSSLDKIVNDLSYSSAAKAKFLEDNGYNFEKAYKKYKSQYGFTEDVINKFINEYPELASFNPNMVDNVNEINEIAPKIKEIAIDMMVESNPKFTKKQLTELFKDEWRLNDITQFYRDINNYRRLNGQKEFDIYETRDNIDKEVEKHKEEFENWLRDKFSDVYNEKYFEDDSGRKKAYTLENLTSYMKKGKTTAQQKGLFDSYSIGQAKGDAARRFMSIEDIKNARDKLVDVETYKDRHKAFENIDDSVRNEIGDTRINNGEDLFEVYSDYYRALGQTARGVDAETALKNNNYDNLSKEQIQKFKEVANTLSSLPAKYFEAKPQRAVGLNEIEVAVIPNNIKESTRKALRNKGIDFVEYDPSVEGDRNRVINKFDNLKFSKNSPEWDNFVNKHNAPEGTKTKLKDIKLPKKEINLPSTPKKQTILPMAREDNVLKVNANEIADFMNGINGNQRKWIGTSTESDILKDKVLIKDLDPEKINYVVESNEKSVEKANKIIETNGYEKALDSVKSMLISDKLPSASDVALAERVLQEAVKNGDTKTAQELVMDIAILGTDLGKATQALSIIKRLTPEGQLQMYTKIIQRAKSRGEKSFQNVEITPEMVQTILDAYKSDGTYDQQDLNNRVERFKQDIADQMKTTAGEKINAWRYLAMLGNPKTHIRNIVSNVAMNGTIKVKNAMARTIESLVPIKNRTKTWKKASDFIKNYAETTANEMKGIITGENKYNEKSSIESKKQIFKNKTLEKISNFNSNALEAEDWFFSKRAFISNLEEYLTANGINTQEDIESRPEVVEKAKNYAKEQAEIATFRQYSKLAAQINNLEKNNKLARFFIEATVPFKKTPINVAKAGVKYSPLGLIKSLSYDIYQVKQGNMEASQLIDNISQGLTGTSLAILGYALAKNGILNGGGDDDKEGKYDTQLGDNQYSLKIGDKSYSISWLSPVAMPLLVGANAFEQLEEKEEWDMNVVSETLAKTLDPLNEMSFMQGLTNALSSYDKGVEKLAGIGESVAQNYVGQFFPTIFSQFASTIDDKKRSTKASANSTYKFGEQTLRSVMYKLPGLRQQLEVATDVWGNEKEQADNIIQRAYESFLAPYSTTKNIASDLDKEIKRVYGETGETKVIPGIPYSYVKYGDETYRMSAKEYTKYKKTYGTTASSTLSSLIKSDSYKNASDEDKAKMIDNAYDYARAKANEEYFSNISDVNYENKTLDKLNVLKSEFGINASTYYANKNEYDYAYKSPEKYKTIKQITTYDKYNEYKDKITSIKENTKNDKEEVIKYINSLNLSVPQKAMFIKQYYKSFNNYDNEIINYINSQKLSSKDKQNILEQLGFKIKDGRVYK